MNLLSANQYQRDPSPALWPKLLSCRLPGQCPAWHEPEPIPGAREEEVSLDTLSSGPFWVTEQEAQDRKDPF